MLKLCTGLTLTLNIDQDNYIIQTGQEAGVRVTILNQYIMPFPASDGFTISPGYATSIRLDQVDT